MALRPDGPRALARGGFERVCRELAESRIDTSRGGEVLVVRKRRGRLDALVVGSRGDSGEGRGGGLAGVREPRRPKPGAPSLAMELALPRGT